MEDEKVIPEFAVEISLKGKCLEGTFMHPRDAKGLTQHTFKGTVVDELPAGCVMVGDDVAPPLKTPAHVDRYILDNGDVVPIKLLGNCFRLMIDGKEVRNSVGVKLCLVNNYKKALKEFMEE